MRPWLNRRRPGSLYSIVEILLLLLLLESAAFKVLVWPARGTVTRRWILGGGLRGGGPGRPPCWRTLKESCKGLGSVCKNKHSTNTPSLGFFFLCFPPYFFPRTRQRMPEITANVSFDTIAVSLATSELEHYLGGHCTTPPRMSALSQSTDHGQCKLYWHLRTTSRNLSARVAVQVVP